MGIKDFTDSATGFTKSPLGIIALFIVLVYGFASLVVGFGQENLKENVTPLVYFMVTFPVIVFFGFLWLVAKHHNKLYGPSDFRNEDNFVRTQLLSATSLVAAEATKANSGNEFNQQQLEEIVDLIANTKPKPRANRVLWVDDRPENNAYERRALEAKGLHFRLATSTDEAIELLKNEKFSVVVSDMSRKEGPSEGYVLLGKIRSLGNKVPFIIYASSNSPEHKRLAQQRGAIGSTSRAQELFQLVMNAVNKGDKAE